LLETGIASVAVKIAGASRTRVYESRKRETTYANAWEEAEERASNALEAEACLIRPRCMAPNAPIGGSSFVRIALSG
jgi:hypothetical protein